MNVLPGLRSGGNQASNSQLTGIPALAYKQVSRETWELLLLNPGPGSPDFSYAPSRKSCSRGRTGNSESQFNQ